ncbi:1,4-dihydroxy-2-naphthoate polyprenyltransferase [Actinomyces howellii]|uniref:1,4-dihydroxy-2-naphthoate octaprenyltransferase n=1 Tax=Actinomyces howellii TaxID=52771 RepID=A0A448HJD0_9ACTO|nr:1,4-dihydroxy-2-naphthoate polyprenyltransferase [Actinomyces howellii]VEG29815.1 1,4-dihydroxy-2-naphthoate octaprenyltransferase [Actinomyces howellii]
MSATGSGPTHGAATSWAEVVRLRTLPAALAPVLLGAGAAALLGSVSVPRTVLAAGVALALQIGSNLANDYSDGVRGTDDERLGPPRLTASGLVSPGSVRLAALGCFAVAGVLGLALVSLSSQWWLLGVGAAAVAAAWFYTGGPRPYGYVGLGEVFVFVFFGLVATVGTAYVQVGSVPGWLWPAASGIGLIACALLMVNNLRDIATDPAHGKRTLAVRLGESRSRVVFALMAGVPVPLGALALAWAARDAGAGSIPVLAGLLGAVAGLAVLCLMAGRAVLPVMGGSAGAELIGVLRDVGLYELAYGLLLALGLVALGA